MGLIGAQRAPESTRTRLRLVTCKAGQGNPAQLPSVIPPEIIRFLLVVRSDRSLGPAPREETDICTSYSKPSPRSPLHNDHERARG